VALTRPLAGSVYCNTDLDTASRSNSSYPTSCPTAKKPQKTQQKTKNIKATNVK